jgi:hypothetical protein
METCPRCGARVGAGATWCGQCFAAIEPERETSGRSVSGAGRLRGPLVREPAHEAVYSRWRGSPTSFGPLGRILLSVLTFIGLVLGYPLLRGFMVAMVGFDVPGPGFMAMYAVLALCAFGYLLTRIWHRTRVS